MRLSRRIEARLAKVEQAVPTVVKNRTDAEFWAAFHATPMEERSDEMQAELERLMAQAAPGIPQGFIEPALAALSDAEIERRLKDHMGA